jgi:hypothetical protein
MPATVFAAKKWVIGVGLNLDEDEDDAAAGGPDVGTGAGVLEEGRLGRGTSSSTSKKN